MVLTHCATTADWPQRREGVLEVLAKAKEKGMIRAHGLSVHGMAPLRTASTNEWLDVGLYRINHVGPSALMDGKPDDVVPLVRKVHERKRGVIGMKILGEGRIKEQREKSLRYVSGLGIVDTMVVGFESPEEIDDLLKRSAMVLDELHRAAA